ncbi:hypothetical protein GCM10010399_13170 [Dactylosporangium fulvum]
MAPLRVELLIFSARDAALHVRTVSRDVPPGRHPDDLAAELAASPASALPALGPAGPGGAQCDGPQPGWAPPPLSILHSTSWRHAEGQVILT